MRTFKRVGLIWGLALLLSAGAFAQTTVNSTTLASAAGATGNAIVLTSASTVAAGQVIFVDREAMLINTLSGTTAQVTRGYGGTAARAHAALAMAYTGTPDRFYRVEVVGGSTCTSASELYLPHISLPTGNVYQCQNSTWIQIGADVGTFTVACRMLLIADMVDQSCFTADRDYVITKITYVSKVVESAGTLTVIPRRQESTEAAASGDALATAISGVSTVAETVTTYTLTTTSALLILDAGDRLGVDFTDDTAGELAGVTITFTLAPR